MNNHYNPLMHARINLPIWLRRLSALAPAGLMLLAGLLLAAAASQPNRASTAPYSLYLPLTLHTDLTSVPPVTPVDLPKGPTLIYTNDNTAMRIFWQASANALFRLDWGQDSAYSAGSAMVSEYDGVNHLYAHTITGLTPGATYFYRVVRGAEYASGTFRAAPAASAQTLKFVSYGDTRTYPDLHDAVAGQILSLIQSDPQYQTVNLMVGDWVSNGNLDSSWYSELFAPTWQNLRAEMANLAILSAIGNHEGTGVLFQRYFPLPYTAARYGSFDYGPAHIAILDQYTSYSAGSAQLTWLSADLAASSKRWKFVVLHEPGWSAGGHANNPAVQTLIQPILEANQVAILFAGHNHYYARAEVSGVTHLTVGSGGAPLYPPDPGMPNIVAVYMGTGYTRIAIDGATLTGEMVGSDGLVKDTFTILR